MMTDLIQYALSNIAYVFGFLLDIVTVFLCDINGRIFAVPFCAARFISVSVEWNYLNELKSARIISLVRWLMQPSDFVHLFVVMGC